MSDLATLVRVSRLYYELGETQEAIAALVGVTRPQVSRLLKEARAQGVVEIRIVDRAEVESPVAGALRERFDLRAVHLAPTLDGPQEVRRRRVGRLAGELLRRSIRDGMVVGVGDGGAMSTVADELPADGHSVDATVVPLCGGFWRPGAGPEPFRRIADAVGASATALHAPGLLDDPTVRNALVAHRGVRAVIDLWARLDVALYGIGGPTWSEASLGPDALAELRRSGAVGEILISPFSIEGRGIDPSLRARPVAFGTLQLAPVPQGVPVAHGPANVEPVLRALRGRPPHLLVPAPPTA